MHAPKLPDTEEFRRQLLGFNEKVWRLEHSRFFSGPAVTFSLNRVPTKILSAEEVVGKDGELVWKLEMQMEVSNVDLQHYDRENVEAFILTYRMLTQNNDRYSIARLAENYKIAHNFVRDAFTYAREQNSSFLAEGSSFHLKGIPVTNRDILDTVIYGELAHSNKHKAETFERWTRWPAHEKMIWLVFDQALRCSMEILQHLRDINTATLMAHFGVRVRDESVFRRLQDKGILSKDATFTAPND
ncbi:hypothetical protein [Paraburkholderia nemoris]|uniref:Uncharacterized protein n=1 Tax=Paraburkholderia nemoris TaxID=2793076 RepID=A0ABN7MEY6_9BURK|nr:MULTISPECIES: hypothetical protein [Paraburkholderia]MBK3813604.1 hypothetical protein [Paraburkholderia aspalathi]CAE6686926.1 hypothetical protein R75777_00016 [Paraburkholderia nemoris]CAE6800006.1 hypothetical protein R69776_05171 [Paraburkholderia nemoris]